jgi:hypothetical protein
MRYLVLLVFLFLTTWPAAAQTNAPCGVVDALGYPLDDLAEGYDDFALYRARFGGNHVGIDIGFDRWGEPVRAAARGRVTYSDIEGWDTEKGVVIVEHTFPDNSVAYTLYGHMEQTDTIFFPSVGACVTPDTILGGIGWPSRGRPHLHYEIRSFMPNDGGPGYVTNNPLDAGWYHPLDFTQLWRIRFTPGYLKSTTFKQVPSLPPVMLDSGQYALASGNTIQGGPSTGEVLWQVETDGVITGIAGLPGDRVVAHTRGGQAFTLQNGRYAALWTVEGLDEPFVTLGETLVFAQPGGALAAYDAAGTALWTVPAVSDAGRVTHFEASGQQVAVGVRAAEGIIWRLVDAQGQVTFTGQFDDQPLVAPAWDGSWIGLDGAQFKRFVQGENHTYGSIGLTPGRAAAATVDLLGNSYVYMGSSANTLISLNPDGGLRWQVIYPQTASSLAPLLRTGSGCLLYTLDATGILNIFSTATGDLIHQMELYAGGDRSSSPRARLLRVDTNETIQVSSGFLSLVMLDGWALGGTAMNECRLG